MSREWSPVRCTGLSFDDAFTSRAGTEDGFLVAFGELLESQVTSQEARARGTSTLRSVLTGAEDLIDLEDHLGLKPELSTLQA